MKRIGSCVATWISLAALSVGTISADTQSVDKVHSTILFRVKHLGASNAWGRFNDLSGKLTTDGDAVTGVDIVVKADSVDTGNAKRDEHLKNADFFNTKQFPEITFKSTKVKKLGDDSFEATGDLTLHGVTKPVTVKLTRTGTGTNPKGAKLSGYDSSFSLKRSDFGMSNMLGGIGDDVLLTVSLECAAGK